MKQLKIAILLESDVVIRNFLTTKALQPLIDNHDVTIILPDKDYKRVKSNPELLGLGLSFARTYIPHERTNVWRKMFHLDQMRIRIRRDGWATWVSWWGVLGWKSALMFFILALPILRNLTLKVYGARLDNIPATSFQEAIANLQPDVILHPSTFDGYFINDMICVGNALDVPTVLLMNSWDNPSIKRACTGRPDYIAVWGEQTKQHTEYFMGMPSDRILQLGAAQFEVYRPQPRITSKEFRREHALPDDAKVLLYAGSSRGADEALHLAWLEQAISDGILPSDLKVVYRPHPWGVSQSQASKILSAAWQHVTIENSMRDLVAACALAGRPDHFLMAEYEREHDLLSSIDMLISPLSTIILEGAMHGVPVLCMVPIEEEGRSIWFRSIKRLTHFREVFSSPDVVVCKRHSHFIPSVRKLYAMTENEGTKDAMKKFSEYFVEQHPVSYGRAIEEFLERLPVRQNASGSKAL